jgi:non-canonical purine NTP pyrophosphatase (RdgB/HAM1 family)
MSKVLFFVSENTAKFKELENCLNNFKDMCEITLSNDIIFQMIKPDGELHEIQSLDRNEIIIHKLKTAKEMIKNIIKSNGEYWIMVEDTSFCIDKEHGFPGPFVKYYLQVNSLEDISNKNWASQAQSIVTFGICKIIGGCDSLDIRVFENCVNGYIVLPSGTNGFGYDSIFKPIGSTKTNAEMSIDEKKLYNPRVTAFMKVVNYIC